MRSSTQAAHDLEPHRQPRRREAAGHAGSGLAREVERVGEGRPRDPVPHVLRPVLGVQPHHREGRHREAGREQQIVLLEERPHAVPVGELAAANLDVLLHGAAVAVLDAGDQPRIHLVAPLGQVLAVDARLVRGPGHANHLVAVGEVALDLLHRGAGLLKAPAARRTTSATSGSTRSVAEVGAIRDAQPLDPAVELAHVVRGRGVQRRLVPVVRARHHARA